MQTVTDGRGGSPGALPLLFRSATPRIEGVGIPGQYDPEFAMWVIGTEQTRKPIIWASDIDLLEITTKTKVTQETDDEAINALEGGRSTSVHGLLELLTKTHVNQESDDTISAAASLLELETKTEADVEHDDDSHPVL